jgi:nucleotide-binding universal stress UspA family protein
MGVFSKKILLATDGSEEAELAARTATEPAEKTGSELHVVYAQPIPLPVGPLPMILSSISSLTPVR